VVHETEQAQLAGRIVTELAAAGFPASAAVVPGPVVELDGLASSHGIEGALRIRPAVEGLELWLGDPASGRSVTVEIAIPPAERNAAPLIAAEAVELVRAGLIALSTIEPPAGPAVPLPVEVAVPAVVTPAPPSPPPAPPGPGTLSPARLVIAAGPATGAAGFDLGPTVNLTLRGALTLAAPLGVELVGLVPLVPTGVEASPGSARLHLGLVGAAARLGFAPGSGRWLPSMAVGLAASFLVLSGRAAEGYRAHETTVVEPTPFLRLGLAVALTARVRLSADVLAGWMTGATSVRIAGDEVARLGPPLLAGALSLEVVAW